MFGGESYQQLLTHEGKEKLQASMLSEINSILMAKTGTPEIEKVLFTTFLMQ